MNNEPVAWIGETLMGRQYINGQKVELPVGTALYTHPVKELTAQEVMEQTHRKILEAHWKVKELTDEEIDQVVDEVWKANPWSDVEGLDINAFARAILRKAQE